MTSPSQGFSSTRGKSLGMRLLWSLPIFRLCKIVNMLE
jgi:hypothetical protein